MNVGPIVRPRLAWRYGFVDRLRTLHDIGRLRDVWFGWLFLHSSTPCNKPAFEGRD